MFLCTTVGWRTFDALVSGTSCDGNSHTAYSSRTWSGVRVRGDLMGLDAGLGNGLVRT